MANETSPPPSADLMREQRLQRNLKIVVAGLALFIFLGLGAVLVRIVGLASGKGTPDSRVAATAPAPSPKTLDLEIPRGSKIVSVSLSGNKLAVYHSGPSGAGIAVIDLGTGRRLLDVKPVETLPRN